MSTSPLDITLLVDRRLGERPEFLEAARDFLAAVLWGLAESKFSAGDTGSRVQAFAYARGVRRLLRFAPPEQVGAHLLERLKATTETTANLVGAVRAAREAVEAYRPPGTVGTHLLLIVAAEAQVRRIAWEQGEVYAAVVCGDGAEGETLATLGSWVGVPTVQLSLRTATAADLRALGDRIRSGLRRADRTAASLLDLLQLLVRRQQRLAARAEAAESRGSLDDRWAVFAARAMGGWPVPSEAAAFERLTRARQIAQTARLAQGSRDGALLARVPETSLPPDVAVTGATARALARVARALREARRQGDERRLPDAETVERLVSAGLISGDEQRDVERRRTHARLVDAISMALGAGNDDDAVALADQLANTGGIAPSVELLVTVQAARRRQAARAALDAAVDDADAAAICRAAEACRRLGVTLDTAGEQVVLAARHRRRR